MTSSGVSGLRWPGLVASACAALFVGFSGFVGHAMAASGCGLTARAGLQELSFESDGVKRRVMVFVPQSYTAKTKVPVVFDLHGSNSFPQAQMERSAWPDVARENGFIVAAPEGGLVGKLPGTHAWNVPGVTPGHGPDDAEFLREAVEQVKARFCVDDTRVFASGYSGGGRMLSQYICNGNRDFSAAGFVMSLRAGYPTQMQEGQTKGKWLPDPKTCNPAQPVSIIAFWGLKDNTNPYVGGGKPYWQYGGQTALSRWAELDGCEGSETVIKGNKISSAAYERCKGGAKILSYTIAGQTHDWPGRDIGFSLASISGKAVNEKGQEPVYAAKRMWAFFNARSGDLMAKAGTKDICADGVKKGTGAVSTACTTVLKTNAQAGEDADSLAMGARLSR
ncbi:polyhydroxybutyrate depolymerase [Agrobacterium vitis]|nr:polyhydroxybutyrate depolymerase [Agrobacterium vitis]